MLSLIFLLVLVLMWFFIIYNRIVQGVLHISLDGFYSSVGGLCACVLNIYSSIWCKKV